MRDNSIILEELITDMEKALEQKYQFTEATTVKGYSTKDGHTVKLSIVLTLNKVQDEKTT